MLKVGRTVWLHVYDLGPVSKWFLNSWGRHVDNTGAFHVGIEIADVEWCFRSIPVGQGDFPLSGVHQHRAKQNQAHIYRESIALGETAACQAEVIRVIAELHERWHASTYHAFQHNCIDFAEAFCKDVCVFAPFPKWVRGCSKGVLHSALGNIDHAFALQPFSHCAGPKCVKKSSEINIDLWTHRKRNTIDL